MVIYSLLGCAVALGTASLLLWIKGLREIGIWIACLSAITATAAISMSIIGNVNPTSANAANDNHGSDNGNQNLRNASQPVPIKSGQDAIAANPDSGNVNAQSKSKDDQKENGSNHFYILYVVATVLMALATICLAMFALVQVRIAQNTAKHQLRAYVTVLNCQTGGFGDGTEAQFFIFFKNLGQTPAYGVCAVINTLKCSIPYMGSFPLNRKGQGAKATLAGGQDMTSQPFSVVLTPVELRMFNQGTVTIYVYGEISYRDIFGVNHLTTFRHDVGDARPLKSGSLITSVGDGNSSD